MMNKKSAIAVSTASFALALGVILGLMYLGSCAATPERGAGTSTSLPTPTISPVPTATAIPSRPTATPTSPPPPATPTPSASAPTLNVIFEHYKPDDRLLMYLDCAPGGKKLREMTGTDLEFDYLVQNSTLSRWDEGRKEWVQVGVAHGQSREGVMEWNLPWASLSLCRSDYALQVILQRQDGKQRVHHTSPPQSIPASFSLRYREPLFISIVYNYPNSSPNTHHFFVYIDSDNNPRTGHATIFPGLGVDYILQDDSLYKWERGAWVWKAQVRVEKTNTRSRWRFLSQAIRASPIDARRPIKIAFSRQDVNWNLLFASQIIRMSGNVISFTEPPVFDITYHHGTPDDHLFVYLDTDNNPSTGDTGLIPGLGVDYLIQDNSLYRYDPAVAPYPWRWIAAVRVLDTPTEDRWVFSASFIGNPTLPFKAAFSRQDASWNALHTSPILLLDRYDYAYNEPSPPPPPPPPPPVPEFDITYHHGTPDDHLFVYLDTDNNPSTGDTGLIPGLGVDYLIQDDSLYRYTGSWHWIAAVRVLDNPTEDRWVFSASFIGNPTLPFKAAFSRQDASWNALHTSPILHLNAYTYAYHEPPDFNITYHHGTPDDHLFVYLDTDNNPSTGDTGLIPGLGVDYLIQDDSLYRYTGSWNWIAAVRVLDTPTEDRWVFSASFIGNPTLPFKAAFSRQDASWNALHTSPILHLNAYTYTYND